jgi:hypothetical protein
MTVWTIWLGNATDDASRPRAGERRDGGAIVLKRPPVRGSAWQGASRGSVMQMVVPLPGAETSVIVPPSKWTPATAPGTATMPVGARSAQLHLKPLSEVARICGM